MATDQIFESGNEWTDAEQHVEQAHEHYENEYWQDANRELQLALEINPNNYSWWFNKGLILDTLSRYPEAIEAFENALDIEPNDPEIMNCLAIDYTRLGQYQKSVEIAQELIEQSPDYEPSYCNRIITYSEMGQHDMAEEMFYMARQIKEHCPFCYYNMGNSLFARQEYNKAIWCWQQTEKLATNHPQINYRIAQSYWAMGQLALAKDHFLIELRLCPGDVEILLDTGILLLEMNELESAKEKFHRIIELEGSHPLTHHYLGELAMHEKDYKLAIIHFNDALDITPGNNGTHYRLAECYLQDGNKKKAKQHLLVELENSPDQPEVLLDMGCLFEEVEERFEAMNCFERAIDYLPKDPRGYQNLSLCYYLANNFEAGIELSHKVLELAPNHFLTMQNLAFAYLKQGNYALATKYVDKVINVTPDNKQITALKRHILMMNKLEKITKPFKQLKDWCKSEKNETQKKVTKHIDKS